MPSTFIAEDMRDFAL